MTGYAHAGYAKSLAQFGDPRHLSLCDGWILERQIPRYRYRDAMGCYPLFTCRDWSQLYADLDGIGSELVSISLVADPFGEYTISYLRQCFKDVVIPFKEHFVVDLGSSMNTFVSNHHRRYAKKALRDVDVEICQKPSQYINDWENLYGTLIERHSIKGIRTFSRIAFEKQLKVPGIVMFRAQYKNTPVGMMLWYDQGNIGYYHLGAYSTKGYELRVSFALVWFAINYFANRGLQWLNLGSGAGIEGNSTDGLSRFKRGWSTGTRTAYFCGRIFDHQTYTKIVKSKGISKTNYFPAYRRGEFV